MLFNSLYKLFNCDGKNAFKLFLFCETCVSDERLGLSVHVTNLSTLRYAIDIVTGTDLVLEQVNRHAEVFSTFPV